jgi:hypothetical protein
MAGRDHRPSISDRARRRAIRAYAAELGVPYSVAARLLAVGAAGVAGAGGATSAGPTGAAGLQAADEHRAWLFAMRERRSFDLRVRDTRLAVDLPLGRAAHLAERFPALRRPPAGPLYDGTARQAALGMLYAVLGHESPGALPTAEELAWVAELGEEAAVDIVCAGPDRAARRLLDDDRWHLWTRVEAALDAGAAAPDRRVRDAAVTLGREFRGTVLRRSLDGARHTLDALLIAGYDGPAPGTRVRVLTGPHADEVGTVVGVEWPPAGAPRGYQVRTDGGAAVFAVGVDDIGTLDQPTPLSSR